MRDSVQEALDLFIAMVVGFILLVVLLIMTGLVAHAQTTTTCSTTTTSNDPVSALSAWLCGYQQLQDAVSALGTNVQSNSARIGSVDDRVTTALTILNNQQSTLIQIQNQLLALSGTATSTSTNGNGGALASPVNIVCTASACTLNWTTLAPLDITVAYYPYGNSAAIIRSAYAGTFGFTHTFSASSLTGATKYVFSIVGKDASGNILTLPSQIVSTQ